MTALTEDKRLASPDGPAAPRWQGRRGAWLAWGIVAFGLLLRLCQYLANRSLWVDEAFIGKALVDSSFADLFHQPLEYSHFVPPGFLVLEKTSIVLFGNSDLILRLVPMLSGCLSLVLFWPVARQFVSAGVALLALCFFAVSDSLIYYSSELKQYSSDVLVTLLLLLLAGRALTGTPTTRGMALLAGAGALAVWFSHPIMFVLAGIGLVLLWSSMRDRDWPRFRRYMAVTIIWAASFAPMYVLTIGNPRSRMPIAPWVLYYWKTMENAFMPHVFPKVLQWLELVYERTFDYPGAFELHGLASALFIAGGLAMGCTRPRLLGLLGGPLLLTLLASYPQLYPFSIRMVLFLTPALYLLVAEGVVQVRLAPYLAASRTRTGLGIALAALLVAGPVGSDLDKLKHPRLREELKPVLQYIQQKQLPADKLYVYYWTEPAFRYYAPFYGFDPDEGRVVSPHTSASLQFFKEIDYGRTRRKVRPDGVAVPRCIYGVSEYVSASMDDFDYLGGQGRVWAVFTHIPLDERQRFESYFQAMGKQLDEYHASGADAYLYLLDKHLRTEH